jgi:hypothetical protein
MPATKGIPIPVCGPERPLPNPKYGTSKNRPKHPKHKDVNRDLKEWGDAWGHWIGLVTDEITHSLEGSPRGRVR